MIFTLGILSIFQMIFLPGYLLLNFFKISTKSILEKIVYSFGLSQFFNYVAAYYLTVMGFFTTPVVYSFLFIEFLFLVFFLKKVIYLKEYRFPNIFNNISLFFKKNTKITNVLMIGAVGIFFVFIYYLIKNIGTIFTFADEIGSYNYWATQWTKNVFPDPIDTMGYPIAISANWAWAYLILGNTEIQFFNKIIVSLFPLVTVLLFLDLGLRKKNNIFFLATVIYGLLIRLYLPRFIGVGLMDLPVATCAVLSFYVLLNFFDSPKDLKQAILVVVFAVWATVIKQAGLFILAINCSILFYYFFKNKKKYSKKNLKTVFFSSVGLILFVTVSWYLWIKYQIFQGRTSSESAFLTMGMHGGKTYFERFLSALSLYFDTQIYADVAVIKGVVFLLTTCSLASVFVKRTRFVFLGIVVPYFLLWAFFFSYEIRTLSLALPFMAYCSAEGVLFLLSKLRFSLKENVVIEGQRHHPFFLKRTFLVGLGAFFVLSFVTAQRFLSDQYLFDRQRSLQRTVLYPDLNEKLYAYFDKHRPEGKIASHYGVLRFLPELKEHYLQVRGKTSLDLIKSLVARKEISYLFLKMNVEWIKYVDDETRAYLKENIRNKKFEHILSFENYDLIKIR